MRGVPFWLSSVISKQIINYLNNLIIIYSLFCPKSPLLMLSNFTYDEFKLFFDGLTIFFGHLFRDF